MAITIMNLSSAPASVGYVDRTGHMAPVDRVTVDKDSTLQVVTFETTGAAKDAVTAGEIPGYLVVPAGYFEGEPPTFYGNKAPTPALEDGLKQVMRRALAPQLGEQALARLENPVTWVHVDRTTGKRVREGIPMVIQFGTTAALAIMFGILVLTGAQHMGTTMVREKDNRAMEMVITSLRTGELVGGKILGMALMSLTQVTVWTLTGVAALGIALAQNVDMTGVTVPWRALFWGAMLGVPGYFLYAALATGLGIIAGDSQQAQQLSGILGMVGMSPLYVMGGLINAIHSPVAVGLTLFPLTAPMVALFRMTLSEVPTWQLGTAAALIIAALIVAVWAVARVFRTAMLLYGQTLTFQQLTRALRKA
jgi:ABC-2 type transport system permease protein